MTVYFLLENQARECTEANERDLGVSSSLDIRRPTERGTGRLILYSGEATRPFYRTCEKSVAKKPVFPLIHFLKPLLPVLFRR